MIRYTLKCDRDHAFESWFQSAGAFDALEKAGQLACPSCGSSTVSKALMAPAVKPAEQEVRPLTQQTEQEKLLADVRRHLEENSEYVGMNFASEARAIHEGDAPDRAIYGEARADEARKLIEDGVPVAPLPFLPTRKAN
ncbi:hypothetical protein CDV50_17605 [Haematobacter massiliensis]|uniref:Uncharacterized protein n=1 Tax=Haematobacter massiliensis TaxID=195105 RepID=A0A086XXK0_9RHOB|nr:DUF1178 family protein [Haematobacter massiliensis]KFI26750.1 hypothetical protein CN97_02625 [Haematobacter massiliensis]OWJ69529.1 hypothetical protein CDV50_17605 [Haematobacter massiliensis]OWJ87607.1 hypothetical protein CDV51_05515 [Haematobacter massiliensis]QBJ23710.1 DUF1178 family protein [Haematobacter massiliensis]